MGWQDLNPLIRKAYQSKGGSVKKPKGFANMDKNRHLEVSSLGGKKKGENYSNKDTNETQKSDDSVSLKLEDILGELDEL